MAVNTTGNKNLDSIVTGELCVNAMEFAYQNLDRKGKFISKIFMGSSFNEIVADAKKNSKKLIFLSPYLVEKILKKAL